MKRYIPAAAAVIALALAVFFQWEAQMAGRQMGGLDQATMLLQEPMDYREASLQAEAWQGELEITLWGQGQEQAFTGAAGHSARPLVIVFEGSTELLFGYGGILHGTDKKGCLLDEKAAEKLFGSHKVEGERISNGAGSWIVRGILPFREGLVVLSAGEGTKEILLDRVTLRLGGMERQAAAELLWQGGFSGSLLRMDFYENFSWAKELVPGKWSDFPGWRRNLEEKKQEWKALSNTEKYVPELLRIRECRRFYRYEGVSVLCAVIFGILLLYYLTFRRKGWIINKKFRR